MKERIENIGKNKIFLIIITVSILLIAVIGVTYAYFSIAVTGNDETNSVILSTGRLGITYHIGNEIRVDKAIPGWSDTKTFTVTNTGTALVYYKMVWTNVTNDFSDKSELVYTLSGAMEKDETQMPSTSEEILLSGIAIPVATTHTYTLTVTFKNLPKAQNYNMDREFMGKIEIRESNPNILGTFETPLISIPEEISSGWSETKEFSVENITNEERYYNLTWTDINNTFPGDELVYSLSGHQSISNQPLPKENKILISNIPIGANETHDYNLMLEYLALAMKESEQIIEFLNQGEDEKRTFNGRLSVVEVGKPAPRVDVSIDYERTATTINVIVNTNITGSIKEILYSLDGTTWTSSDTFTDLSEASTYNIYVRIILNDGGELNYGPILMETRGVPTPTIEVNGEKGENDWYTGPVLLSINKNQTGSTEIITQYQIIEEGQDKDDEGWITGNSVSITNEGIFTILYRNINTKTEETKEESITIKKVSTPPTTMIVVEKHGTTSIKVEIISGGLEFIAPPVTYNYFLNEELIHTTTEKSYTYTGLTHETEYTVKIEAINEAGLKTTYQGEKGNTGRITNLLLDFTSTNNTLIASLTSTNMELIEKFEYRLDNGVWQESNTFTGLISANTYTLYGRITDISGNVLDVESISVHTKGVPIPSGSVTSGTLGSNNWYTSANVTYTINPNKIGNTEIRTEYSLNNGTTWTSGTTVTLTAAGINNILFRNINTLTNEISNNVSAQIRIDRTQPTVTHTLNPTTQTTGTVRITLSVTNWGTSGTGSITHTANTALTRINDTTYDVIANGTYTFTITNQAGLTRAHNVTITNSSTPIRTANEMYNVRNNLAGNYVLMNNIDLSTCTVVAGCGTNWLPIGTLGGVRFSGTFDGRSHAISNLRIDRTAGTEQGLFGVIENAPIKNINLPNVNVRGGRTTGALVGNVAMASITSLVSGNTVSGTVTCSAENCGGLIGIFQAGTIENNVSSVTVNGTDVVGGLIGYVVIQAARPANHGGIVVNNNSATGNVTATGEAAGGLIGFVRNQAVNGSISIRNNYATGAVQASRLTGGLIGYINLMANPALLEVTQNFARGNATATEIGSGGLISLIQTIEVSNTTPININNNYSTGLVRLTTTSHPMLTGGFIGYSEAIPAQFTLRANFTNNYTISAFTGSAGTPSGFMGFEYRSNLTFTGNYWNTTTSGNTFAVNRAARAGVTGWTTTQMRTATPYSGWSTSIWQFTNNCYPVLLNNAATVAQQRAWHGC